MPAKSITTIPLSGMGSSGLNTQAQDSTLGPEWLTEANGVVFDLQGRIASRKGIKMVSQAIASSIKSIGGYIKSNRTREYYAGAGNAIYKIDTSSSPYPLTAQTFSGSAQTISDSNWTWVNFNDELWGIQTGHKAINYDGTNWYDIDDLGAYAAPTGVTTFDPSCGLGDFGHMWYGGITEAPGVVYYSDNLIGEKVNGGAAGSVDLKTVWGNDEVVGLASIMDKIVIFGKQNIAIYNGASNPDIIFLSYEGLMSVGRLQQTDGKAPLTDLSITVRNDLTTILSSATVANIKSSYYAEDGLIITFIPDEKKCYVFDIKLRNQLPRVTTWSFTTAPLCGLGTIDGKLFVGLSTGVAEYTGYYDVTITSDGSGGWTTTNNNYSYTFQTSWLDLNSPTFAKIIKSGLFAITGGRGSSTTVSVYKDFELGSPYSKTISLVSGVTISLYTEGGDGAALAAGTRSLYDTAKYGAAAGPKDYKVSLGRTGKVIKLKMDTTVEGHYSSLTAATLLTKQGKIR